MNTKLALAALTAVSALCFSQLAPPAGQAQESAVITGKVTPQASGTPARAAPKRVSRIPRAFTVPDGKNYILRPGRTPTFDILATGQVLEDTHCVQINCPPGMEAGTVCWRCYEITAE
jgi:hypothetical protein